jgi:ubiquinone/menaquinone biosynthesis C-methylase UbiE
MSRQYHLQELEIARDPNDRRRAMPPFSNRRRILDVGCGAGQTLIAANLPDGVQGFGVDPDPEAIKLGQEICPPSIKLSQGMGEKLAFPDSYFDLVFSRVALPYMHIGTGLREMWRVLEPDGQLWLALHPRKMAMREFTSAIRRGLPKLAIFRTYVLINGFAFNTFGTQFACPILRRQETYQTAKGITRALERAGFIPTAIQTGEHFIVEARKSAKK